MDADIVLIPFSDRPAWEAASQGALPGQSWGHAAGLAADGYEPELAVVTVANDRLLLPFHRRDFQGQIDIATLPGLSGAWAQSNSYALFAAWSRFAAGQGWVAGYIQLSPENDALRVPLPDHVNAANALFVFDVQGWSIMRSVEKKIRYKMKLGDRVGAQLCTDADELSHAFPALYAGHLHRVGGHAEFSAKALDRWFGVPGIVAFGARMDGRIVNIQMCRQHGHWADLHLTGATENGRDLQAWLLWTAIESFKGGPVRYFNIGGYGERGDGLHLMKSRLGTIEHPLRAVCQVYDRDRYDRLCARTGAVAKGGFFPAYRAKPNPG